MKRRSQLGAVVRFRGRVERIANPSAFPVCPRERKPVSEITDRAKRYRANQAACLPSGPRRCEFCDAGKVEVHHRDGDESNGRRSNLGWACRSCNTKIGAAMAKLGRGRRTRQFNPAPDFKLYGWAVSQICRKRDADKGLCSPSSDPDTLKAVEIIRATPPSKRRAYARKASEFRAKQSRARYSEVPF